MHFFWYLVTSCEDNELVLKLEGLGAKSSFCLFFWAENQGAFLFY
ncbi:hypothetical protein SGRA_2086 [Saprospira grandis str. Lewin]|uniref:Uncharacterized protein n=1 Tax=Saprospira grandis (strain Lewin) TaxID=984262 RepID=H6L2R0_SAPGL|nr:hypothetical protein SGRA_2086 [Saprospira grandis str. Lewin]